MIATNKTHWIRLWASFLVFSRAVVDGSGEGTLAGIQSWYVIKIQRSSLFAFTVPVNSPACFLPSFPFEDQ